jgi:hypothetical protein
LPGILKDPSRIALAVIAGDPTTTIQIGPITTPFQQVLALEPSCQTTIDGHLAIARPGIRLADLVSRFGERGRFLSVCQPDYAAALDSIGELASRLVGPCIAGPIDATDTDLANPGVQPACTVTSPGGEVTIPLPACAMADATTPDPNSAVPCAYFVADATCTGTPTGLALRTAGIAPTATLDLACAPAP